MSTVLLLAVLGAAETAELRELSTDRPDITESPRSVDAGHFQAEFGVARLVRDQGQTGYSLLLSNLKLGVTSFMDVQLVIEPLVATPEESGGHDVGFGDMALRTKLNLFGNEGGPALALMPWVKLPTAGSRGNGAWEGGLIVPAGFDLPLEFSLGLMAELDWAANDAGDEHDPLLLTSAALGHDIYGDVSFFVELVGVASAEDGRDYELFVDGGPVWLVTPSLQLDAGVGFGLTEAAEDFFAVSGVSFKF